MKKSPWLIFLALVFGSVLIGLDRTVANLAVPNIMSFFGITLSAASWVASIYILSSAIFVPLFGKLGGRIGYRRVFFWGFLCFIIASLLAALSWNMVSLLSFRFLQGMFGAAIFPSAMVLLTKGFPDKKQRAHALGIWSAAVASSIILGPLIGGPLIDHFSWRSIFLINLPIGIIGLVLLFLFVPKDKPHDKGKFDFWGAMMLMIAISSLAVVLDKGLEWGWGSLLSLVLYGLFVLCGVAFVLIERKVESPIIDLKLFKNKTLSSVLIITFISQGLFVGSLLMLSFFMQNVMHLSATKTGYIFLPFILSYIIFSVVGGKLAHKFSAKYSVMIGLLFSTCGAIWISILAQDISIWQMIVGVVLMGCGLGLTSAPLTTEVTSSVGHKQVGVASGLLNLTRNISGVFGIAFLSTLITSGFSYSFVFGISAGAIAIGILVAFFIKK